MNRIKLALNVFSKSGIQNPAHWRSIFNAPFRPITSPTIHNKEGFFCEVPREAIEFSRSRNCCKDSGHAGLEGKNVAYVGGFGGIGYACCKEMVLRGIQNLVILDTKDNVEKRTALLGVNPNVKSVCFVPLDLTEGKEAIQASIQETSKHLGHIDILVNGAGMLVDSEPKRTILTNVLGPIETTLAAIPLMSRKESGKGGGLIVNLASVLGLVPGAFAAVYTSSKHAIVGFTRCCAHEHYKKITGISHIVICHGITVTELASNFSGTGTFEYSRALGDEFQSALSQTPEQSAIAMTDAIQIGKNGSICIVDLGKMCEVKLPLYWKPTFKKKS